MDLKQLRALLTVADVGSVTRAATVLNIVQPALSRQLRLLEDELGTPLFQRGRTGMQPTDAGTAMIEYARRILHEVARAKAEIRPADGPVSGIVSVGLLASTSQLLAADLVSAVARDHPGIRLRVSVGYSGHVLEWLQKGEVDVALIYDPRDIAGLQASALVEEALWAVAPPAAGLRRPIALERVARERFVMPSAAQGLRGVIEYAVASQSLQLNVAAETNDLNVQKRLVMEGHGWTILPAVAVAQDVVAGRLCAAPLSRPPLSRKVAMATAATRPATAAVRCAGAALVACMKQAVGDRRWTGGKWLG